MLTGRGYLISGQIKDFTDRKTGEKIEYTALTLAVGGQVFETTGPKDVLEGLNGSRAQVEAGVPVEVEADVHLRQDFDKPNLYKPKVKGLREVRASQIAEG